MQRSISAENHVYSTSLSSDQCCYKFPKIRSNLEAVTMQSARHENVISTKINKNAWMEEKNKEEFTMLLPKHETVS